MTVSLSNRSLTLGNSDFVLALSYTRYVFLLFILSLFINPLAGQDLDPDLPPGGNFDLTYWKLTRPNQQERDADQLSTGYQVDGEFYTDPVTGAMVFWCPNDGNTGGSTYPRNELREMIRRLDTSIPTRGINKNNWVFSSSTMENQEAAGGVDGVMTATVAVDHVSLTSDEFRKVGRTIVGQIHASDDEPCRIYYRKLPGNTKGSVYFAHEPTTGAEQWYDMIGSRNDGAPDPVDGVALGEKFSYEIKVIGNMLTVTIMREGKPDVVKEVDMTNSGFADDWMYFKAGNYNQNNAGDADEYAQVSFFALDVKHFSPTPPTAYLAPTDIPRFKPFLAECKLQGPTSSTLRAKDALNGYSHPDWFKVVDGDKILFNQSGDSRRTELRNETNWDLTQADRSLHGRIDIVEQTCDQVTVMQIHDDAGAGPGPNKPLLRIYKHNAKSPTNHLWAAVKTDDGGVATSHILLGEDPGGYFNCDIRLVDGRMIIDFEGEEKVNMDVSFWTYPSYWKAGVYLQDNGEATAYFDDLFEEDGTQQNFFPSVSITDPTNNTNFLPGSDIMITAEAEDSDGSITKVEFFEGGSNKLGEVTSVPYTFTWTNVAGGDYILTAKATDNEEGSRTSLSTKITVRDQVNVTGVTLVDINGAIAVGASTQLEAIVSPSDAINKNVTFSSEDESIATVSSTGLLTAISEGMVRVTVTTEEGEFTDTQMIHVLSPSSKLNWAVDQPAEGTGTADGSNVVANLVDDNTDTRWSVKVFPQTATIDLEKIIAINQTEVTCYENRAYQFIIEGALTQNGPYATIVDRSSNKIPGTPDLPIVNAVDNVQARFVRITVTGADIYDGEWVSLTELRVFGEQVTSIENELANTEVLLSPNPVSLILNIEGGEAYDFVSVFDQSGRRVIQEKINKYKTINVSELQSGIYLVKLEGKDKHAVKKLIKL